MAETYLFEKITIDTTKTNGWMQPEIPGLVLLHDYFNSRNVDWHVEQRRPVDVNIWNAGYEALYAQCLSEGVRPWFVAMADTPLPGTASTYQQILFGAGTRQNLGTSFKGITVESYFSNYIVAVAPFGGWKLSSEMWDDGVLWRGISLWAYYAVEKYTTYFMNSPTYMIINGDEHSVAFPHYQHPSNYDAIGPVGTYVGLINPAPSYDPTPFPYVLFGGCASPFTIESSSAADSWGSNMFIPSNYEYTQNFGLIEQSEFDFDFAQGFQISNPRNDDLGRDNSHRLQNLESFLETPVGVWRDSRVPTSRDLHGGLEFWGSLKFVKSLGCRSGRNTSGVPNVGFVGHKRNNVNLDTSRMMVGGLTYNLPATP
jgi:hypothetical protein